MLIKDHPFNANDFRQCLRIATGSMLGLLICKLFNWQNGVFYAVTPILLLGILPKITMDVARQVMASAFVAAIEVGVIYAVLNEHPPMMMMAAFCIFLYRFSAMSNGSYFLFGSTGVVNLSVMLHFASYPSTDVNLLIVDNIVSSGLAVAIAFLMMYLWPDVEPRKPRPPMTKDSHRIRHETLLGATMATISFAVFQVLNLQDSISAQATSLLMLFPMNWDGMLGYARKRAMGAVLGVVFGITAQLILYDWSDMLLLVVVIFWIGLLIFSHAHVIEASGSGIGFGAMTTVAILFGQYLDPDGDLIFSALYRISSIVFAAVVTLMVAWVLHKLLNQFEATKYGA
ncbi:MAG: DUF2955 domain-containing protein [Vibrio sp.]